MAKKEKEFIDVEPDKRILTQKQADYLASISNLPSKELVNQTLAEAIDRARWRIHPDLWLYRRVCGRVVKTDPETGEKHGVPNATVYVEDTDCNFVLYAPRESPFIWLFPYFCTREVIATTTTDACGNFCVWIPRFDIDRVVRFRRDRICFPEIVHPDLCDVLHRLGFPCPPIEIPFPRPPIPQPDPPPFLHWGLRDVIRELGGPELEEQIELLAANRQFGGTTGTLRSIQNMPLLKGKIPPPLPRELRGREPEKHAKTLAGMARISDQRFKAIDFGRFVGPFYRCVEVLTPVWTTIVDVPDITFRVTQDVDGDGAEEEIYSEGYFDVRWNTTSIPDLELEAQGSALASPFCGEPPVDVGQCVKPELLAAGLMPLQAAYHNAATGYALRPNRPRHELPPDDAYGFHNSPELVEPSEAPYCQGVPVFACHRFGNAQFYRLMYAYETASEVPFTGQTWWVPTIGGGAPIQFAPDADGWYPIIAENQLVHPHWVFYWRTGRFPNGKYTLRLQIGNAARNVLDQSEPVAFVVDNRRPLASFDKLEWRALSGGTWVTLPSVCPVVTRPSGSDIEFRVTYTASAVHFRDVKLSASGCGGGSLLRAGSSEALENLPIDVRSAFEHWHTSPDDNTVTRMAVFHLPGSRPAGAYSFNLDAHTRAFNPAGGQGGPDSDWYFDPAHLHAHPGKLVAIVDG